MSTLYAYKGQFWKVIHDFQYTGESVPFTLDPGKYLLICNGARGGSAMYKNVNYGGTSMGVLNLKKTTKFYAVVGGNGGSGTSGSVVGAGGFNGGGNGGRSCNNAWMTGAGGGGASDIRLYEDDGTLIEQRVPEEYAQIEYVGTHNNGDLYIDTEYLVKPNTRVICDARIKSSDSKQWSCLFGTNHNGTDPFLFYVFYDSIAEAYYSNGNGSSAVNTNFVYNTKVRIETNSTGVSWSVNGKMVDQIVLSKEQTTSMTTSHLFLFNAASGETNSTANSWCWADIYGFKIYEDDTLIADLVPCYRKSDNVGGLYDTIRNKFFTSATSTALTKGPRKPGLYNKSLLSRIIVAGGGGGGINISDLSGVYIDHAGNGGGIVGGYVVSNSSDKNYHAYASQTSGYDFGTGMSGEAKVSAPSCGAEGASGGGGGWFGGYTCNSTNMSYSSSNGGGGSGYVLTADSYKPDGYLVGEEYYLTDAFLEGGSAIDPCIMVCTPTRLSAGDTVIFPCIGETEHVSLPIGTYIFECYGGDGGCRNKISKVARGGYAKGTLNNIEPTNMYVNVGGSGLGSGFLSGSWAMMNHPTLMFNGGGSPGTLGDIRSCAGGGASDVRIGSDSLYARIIVAGGAGGMGKDDSNAGAGGGTTGGTCSNASYGESPGPGTQTSSPQSSNYPAISGKFGYGGSGIVANSGYGGAGGGGWFGGSGTYPDGGGDDDRAGNGGSGYVLTADSYKPEGYLLNEDYYLSDTVLTTGGNTLPVGHTRVTMEVIDVLLTKMVTHDEEGFKRYDAETGMWVYLSSTITAEDIDEYGVSSMTTDEGLLNDYQIYILDTDNIVENLEVFVMPNRQTITSIADTPMKVSKVTLDATYDQETFDINISTSRKGVADDAQLILNLDVDKKIESDGDLRIYCVYAQTSGNASHGRYIAPPSPKPPEEEDPNRKKYLLKVGSGTGVPIYYKQYLTTLNGNAVTSIQSVVACEHDRVLYIAMVLNNTTLRLQKINLLTNKSSVIREIPRSSLDNYYYGGLLVDDNYLYLTSSNNENQRILYRVDLNNPMGEIKRFTPGSSNDYNFECFGKMEWYNDRTIVIDYKRGFMLFDTKTQKFTAKYYSSKNSTRWDMSVGKKIALSHYNSATNLSVYTCNLDANTWSTITLPGDGVACSCYDGNGRFYIAQTSYLVVWNEETETIEQSIAIPWKNPNMIQYTKGVVYAIMKGSNQLWMYNTKTKIFNMILLPWTIPSMSGSTVMRPAVFDGYIFIPYFKLGIVSYIDPPKYNLGGKYDQYKFLFNKEHEAEYNYDNRFVTFRDSCMTVHDGTITIPMTEVPESSGIKFAPVNKSEYNKLKRISFQTKEISDVEETEKETT